MQAAFGGGAADVSDRLFFPVGGGILRAPKAPDDYLKLDNEINKVLTQGGEYAAPLSGELTQKVQLQDLDGDGVQELLPFSG